MKLPRKNRNTLYLRRQILKAEKALKIKAGIKPAERLKLVQQAIMDTAQERIAAINIIEASPNGKEKERWERRALELTRKERFLRLLAKKYHSKK